MVKHQYLLLKGHNLLTSTLESDFDNVKHMVEGEKEVAWADQSTCGQDPGSSVGENANFNISALVDFPLLNCVPATRKT